MMSFIVGHELTNLIITWLLVHTCDIVQQNHYQFIMTQKIKALVKFPLSTVSPINVRLVVVFFIFSLSFLR